MVYLKRKTGNKRAQRMVGRAVWDGLLKEGFEQSPSMWREQQVCRSWGESRLGYSRNGKEAPVAGTR